MNIIVERIKKHQQYPNKYAHHLRLQDEYQVDQEVIDLLKIGYDYSMR